MTDVRGDIFRGAIWLSSFKVIERGIGLVSTLILVRILVPEDFGLVAMGTSIIVAVQVFMSFGFDVVLIQNQGATRAHYDTAWTFKLCFGLIGATVLFTLAHPVAHFYRDERLILIMYAIAGNFVLSSLENIAVVDFRKYMEFHKEVIYQLLIKLSGFAVTVPIAIATRSYWALIAGMMAGNFARLILSFAMKPTLPTLTFSRASEIFGFSAWLMINNALFTGVARVHDFIIGRVAGAHALGLFNVSLEISNLITTELVAPINRAAFPGYAKLSSDTAAFRKTYLDVMACIMLVSLPAATGIAAIAELLVPLVLGKTWLESVPVIQILAVYGAVYSLTTNSVYVFHALAQPRLVTRLAVYQLLVLIPVLYVMTTTYGLLGAAWGLLGVNVVIAVPMMWFMVSKALDMSAMRIVEHLWRPLIASACMYLAVGLLIRSDLMSDWFLIGQNLSAVLLGASCYVAVVYALWWQPINRTEPSVLSGR